MYEVLFIIMYICLAILVFYSLIKLLNFLSFFFVFEKRQLESFEEIKDKFFAFCKGLNKLKKGDDIDFVLKPFLNEVNDIVSNVESIPFAIKTVLMFSVAESVNRVISIFFNENYNEYKKKKLIKKEMRNFLIYELSLSYICTSILNFSILLLLSSFLIISHFHTFYLYFKFWF